MGFDDEPDLSAKYGSIPGRVPVPPRHSPKTSQGRFHNRIDVFRMRGIPVARHHFWWFVHNAVCHPLIAVLPIKATFDFHDYTSRKINAL